MIQYEKINNDSTIPLNIVDIFLPEGKKTMDEILANYEGTGVSGKHWHHSLEIIVPVFGETIVWREGFEKKIVHGDFAIVSSKTIHNVYSLDDQPYKGYALQINHDYLKENIPNYENIEFGDVENLAQRKEILSCIYSMIAATFSDDEYVSINIKGKILELIYLLLKYAKQESALRCIDKTHLKHQNIDEIVNYIDEHYAQDLSVSEIAEKFCFSYGYVSKLFRNNLGVTVKDYIMSVRLKKSISDLLYTNLSITEIVEKNGFANNKSFYKKFQNVYKMSPSKYRNELRK